MASWVVDIYARSTIWKNFVLTKPQRPRTEKVLEFNMSFHDSVIFLQNIKRKWCYSSNLLNSRTWKPLKSSVVIFQSLETSSALLTSVASATPLASTAYKAHLPKKLLDPDGLIITGTKITIAGNFLWNGTSEIQFFTKIWHLFWRRPLRPHEFKKVSNGGSGQVFTLSQFLMVDPVHDMDLNYCRKIRPLTVYF